MNILLWIFILLTLVVSIFIAWIYLPTSGNIGMYSSILTSFFSVYGILLTAIFLIISIVIVYFNTWILPLSIWILSLLNFIWWIYPVAHIYCLARGTGTKLSITDNLTLSINRWEPNLERSIQYLSIDGQDLYLDYYPADNLQDNETVKPLILIHGGWFVEGNRSQEPEWREYFRVLWYSVFDVQYRLATKEYQTWDKAATDINSAIVWLTENQNTYKLDMSELVLAGSSAGGSLALQAAYGWVETFPSSISWVYTKAKKVIAYFPATSMEPLWNRDTRFLSITSRWVGMKYTWGGPEEFPKRYERINTALLANKNSSPTLVIHGKSDHLIPYDTLLPLENALNTYNIKNTFVFIPYAEHGFTYFSGSFWFQIAKKVTWDFLSE